MGAKEEEKRVNYEENEENGYVKVETEEEFTQFLKDGLWEEDLEFNQTSFDLFKKDTGYTFEDVKGKWFCAMHNRVYFLEDEK